MSGSDSDSALVLELAEEFLQRYRQGERPPLREYVERHPELADEIREVFPAMALMENIALADDSLEGPARSVAAAPLEQLGDYRIIRQVGQGGMGIVYEAEQVSLGRHVALKVLPRKMLLDSKQRRRFEREARAAAKLHHTNIVPVFGVGEHDGMPYYVMQFIQGLGLDDVLDELRRLKGASEPIVGGRISRKEMTAAEVARSLLTGQFEPVPENELDRTADAPPNGVAVPKTPATTSRADTGSVSSSSVVLPGQSGIGSSSRRKPTYWHSVAQIGVQVAEALEHAHGQGILHRDIKPSNLLLDLRGTVWVTDFGLAKAEDQQELTHTGDILGTLRYMPPEAFEGKTDRRGDIYSLGLTLYELLALRPAFDEADRNRLIKLVTTTEPSRLARLNPSVPRDLVTIVHKAIDRDPAHRYATAAELALDLQRFLHDEPIRARRVSLRERAWRWCRRNPALAFTVGLAAAALVAVTVVSCWLAVAQAQFAVQQTQSYQDLREEQGRTREALTERDSKLLELRKNSAWAAVDRAQGLLAQGQAHRALLWLTRGLELAPAEDAVLQNTIRTNLASLRGELPLLRTTFAYPSTILTVAFCPDGRTVALAGGDTRGDVRFYDAATGKPVSPPLPQRGPVQVIAFNPDGKTLFSGDRSRGRFWDVSSGEELGPPLEPQMGISCAVFSPDGKTIALGGDRGQVSLWDVATRKPKGQLLETREVGLSALAFSPDGKTLAGAITLLEGRGECPLWDTATGQRRAVTLLSQSGFDTVAFSPDGLTIATGGFHDNKARLWDAATGKPKGQPLEHQGELWTVVFSPDGRTVLTAGGGLVQLWEAETGQSVGEFPAGPPRAAGAAFNPDGRSILVPGEDNTARLWSRPEGKETRPPVAQPGWVSALTLSRDGLHLLVRSGTPYSGEVRLWDGALEKPLGPARAHAGWYHGPALSPDGKTILTSNGAVYGSAARLWDGTTGEPIGESIRIPGFLCNAAFSPDGTTVAMGGFAADLRKGSIQLLNAVNGTPLGPPLDVPYPVGALAFSPDGKTVLAGCGDEADEHGEVRRWDLETRKEIGAPYRHRDHFGAVAFSPDGKRFAAGSRDGTARLWDAATGAPIGSPMIHQGEVNALAFSPDGRVLATGSDDGKVRFWNAATARLIGTPRKHFGAVNAVVFTPDGATLLSGGDDRMIRSWRVPAALEGDVDSLRAWAEYTCGLTLSSEGTVAALESSAWQERGKAAAVNPFVPEAIPGFTYHQRQALSCIANENWSSALWHLDREIGGGTSAWLPYVLRTQIHLQLGREDRAQADFTQASKLGPYESVVCWYRGYAFASADRGEWKTTHWYLGNLINGDIQTPGPYVDVARACLKQGAVRDAASFYQQAVAMSPADVQLWLELAHLQNSHGRWKEAAVAFVRAIELDPGEHTTYFHAAPVLLLAGDKAGYRRVCREMLKRFGSTNEVAVAERVVKSCLLQRDAVEDPAPIWQLAERVLLPATRTENNAYAVLALGMAEYRQGRLTEAVKRLTDLANADPPTSLAQAMACGYLALAYQDLGRHEEASRALDHTAAIQERLFPKVENFTNEWSRGEWIRIQVVYREAKDALPRIGPLQPQRYPGSWFK